MSKKGLGAKTANQGAEKRKEENACHIWNLIRVIIGCNFSTNCNMLIHIVVTVQVVYVLVRMIVFHSSFTWKHWVGLILTSLAYAVSYKQLDSMAKPICSDDGELIDGGFDMSTGRICGYLHDIIYMTSFVQITSLTSDKFWYTYLVLLPPTKLLVSSKASCPTILRYLACSLRGEFVFSSLLRFLHDNFGMEEDEKTRQKHEKMEKKASRPKFVKTRTS
ncbi:LOW QUALITY PROTEIN: hypothetical protein Cgig2_015439 [Carnegiea gigantea]|uniref:Uncharacterized protein n=1 Tax=Carnegiea gigantea TaxID=171969 RepID=A0A9Q1JXC8_9CARY|nr:LOW QUALITY PROTEIN: hypothetical protein Cgig2_015439 [Carnegiea gigantea]